MLRERNFGVERFGFLLLSTYKSIEYHSKAVDATASGTSIERDTVPRYICMCSD